MQGGRKKRPQYLLFHIEKIDGELIPIFETYKNGNQVIYKYYMDGQLYTDALVKKNYANKNAILKCPIIIKTSDGDLELLPDGKLLLQNK
ncbi:hypothetical protein FACS189434_11660 [Bacteroidia bacterium]|nr:hypothetical protein FACS189434_11660 [Bacteroidia bacterium]